MVTTAWPDGDIYSPSKAALLVSSGFFLGKEVFVSGDLENEANDCRFYLPPSPTQTKSHGLKGYFRGKNGWFSEREEVIMVTRILRDDPGKSSMHNVSSHASRMFTRWHADGEYRDKQSHLDCCGRRFPTMTCTCF